MAKNLMRYASEAAFPVRGMSSSHLSPGDVTVTQHSEESLRLFAGIHRSKQFSIDTAHQLFAGVKRKK